MSILSDTAVTPIPAGTWSIDPVWSSLEFEVKKAGLIGIKGRVPGFTGTIHGGEHPSIEGTVDVSSITSFDETRDTHVQSPDFLDAQRYPELRFESTSVEFQGEELVVQGQLTIKGTTKAVELRGTFLGSALDPMGNERIGLEVTGTIDRTEFGVNWNLPLPGGDLLLPNEVVLKGSFAAVRAT